MKVDAGWVDDVALNELAEQQVVLGVLEQKLPLLGQGHAAARAVEELHLQALLEVLDPRCDRRLREMHVLGSLPHPSVANDHQEGAKLLIVDTHRRSGPGELVAATKGVAIARSSAQRGRSDFPWLGGAFLLCLAGLGMPFVAP